MTLNQGEYGVWPFATRCEFCGDILPDRDPHGGLCQDCYEDNLEAGSDPEGYTDMCTECGAILAGASYDHDPLCSCFPVVPL